MVTFNVKKFIMIVFVLLTQSAYAVVPTEQEIGGRVEHLSIDIPNGYIFPLQDQVGSKKHQKFVTIKSSR